MKIKLDENLPVSAAKRLVALGFDTDTVHDEKLEGKNDDTIWIAAQNEKRVLVTQDLDFSDVRRFSPGSHHGLVLVRLHDTEQTHASDYLTAWFALPEARTWQRCFVVASASRIRVLRP